MRTTFGSFSHFFSALAACFLPGQELALPERYECEIASKMCECRILSCTKRYFWYTVSDVICFLLYSEDNHRWFRKEPVAYWNCRLTRDMYVCSV